MSQTVGSALRQLHGEGGQLVCSEVSVLFPVPSPDTFLDKVGDYTTATEVSLPQKGAEVAGGLPQWGHPQPACVGVLATPGVADWERASGSDP